LVDAIRVTMTEALITERQRQGGLSESKLGDRFRVHNRQGLPCPECETPLRRVSFESHEITYCPTCQTGGKILADRRMSRLVK
jgi:formamidopyrimidine-DNA glycosylase